MKTGNACPEQYEATMKGRKVGYLRLRHGAFTVAFPDVGGEIIYEAAPNGDGMFMDNERDHYLNEAKAAIVKHIKYIEPERHRAACAKGGIEAAKRKAAELSVKWPKLSKSTFAELIGDRRYDEPGMVVVLKK